MKFVSKPSPNSFVCVQVVYAFFVCVLLQVCVTAETSPQAVIVSFVKTVTMAMH